MDRRRQFISASRLSIAIALCGGGSGMALGRECDADLYDKADFRGSHVRIEGPAELADLKTLDGQDWSNRIESLKVGKNAELTVFRREGFDTEARSPVNHPHALKAWGETNAGADQDLLLALGPGRDEHHLGELKFHRNINSLKLKCLR